MRVLTTILVLLIAISFSETACGRGDKHNITGVWMKKGTNSLECDCGDCINIQFHKVMKFCVESNQIYLNIYYKLDRNLNKVDIFMHSVMDVGAGGGALPWDDFDKQIPLAEIDVTKAKNGTVSIKWLGLRRKGNGGKVYPFGDAYAGTYERPVE